MLFFIYLLTLHFPDVKELKQSPTHLRTNTKNNY